MSDAAKDKFIRWQSITRTHFSYVVNLVLGLSTGLLAFQANLLVGNSSIQLRVQHLIIWSSIFQTLSIISALTCSLNRLDDFRKTAQITRKKMKGDTEGLDDLKLETKIIGARTWKLLWSQLILFTLSALLLVAAMIARLCHD